MTKGALQKLDLVEVKMDKGKRNRCLNSGWVADFGAIGVDGSGEPSYAGPAVILGVAGAAASEGGLELRR